MSERIENIPFWLFVGLVVILVFGGEAVRGDARGQPENQSCAIGDSRSSCEQIRSALETVASIQAKYKWGPGTAYFERLHQLLSFDIQSYWRELDTLTWWGGAGSFADFVCIDASRSEEETRADDRTYRKALIEIADAIPKASKLSKRAQSLAGIFRYWEAIGI
jgi:hypothetical protein